MVTPNLAKKEELILTVAENTKKLFREVYNDQRLVEDEDTPKIKVSNLISKMSFYYEKIRNSVDYKEEHLLRKNAILRILKRLTVIEGKLHEIKPESASKNLLIELIRGGYLPNNRLPEEKITEIASTIEKYIKFKKAAFREFDLKMKKIQAQDAKGLANHYKEKMDLSAWIIAMAASDIEERLGRNKVDQQVISYMYEILEKNIELTDTTYQKDKEIQTYIGIHRNLLKFDRDMAGFVLFKYFNPNWKDANDEEIEKIGASVDNLKLALNYQLDHPLVEQLNRIISRYTVFFSILTDVIKEDPAKVYESFKTDPKAFSRDIKKICNKRYAAGRRKLWRAGIRSVIYIFLTKSIFAFILEVPVSKFFGEPINPFALTVNIIFPALLLFLTILFTRFPGDDNTNRIVEGINEIVFKEKERKEPFRLKTATRRGVGMNIFFGVIYSVTFFLSFGAVIWLLDKAGFNWVSITIFLFFLAFVSFFAIRVRKVAKELIVIEPKENILMLFSDFFYTPVVVAGKWLSEKFSRINVFVFVLDFIIETPFKIFVEIAEEWTKYVKEQKDKIG